MKNYLENEISLLEENLGYFLGQQFSYPLAAPEHVYFALTNRCNLKCKMCEIHKNPSKKSSELNQAEIKNILTQIQDLAIKHIIFSGGEPLLREDLLEIIEYSRSLNFPMIDLITNGLLLSDELIQKLIKLKLNHITISLDGLGEVNDQIRGKDLFKKIESKFDRINYYKTKYSSNTPTVGINFTIMNHNIEQLLPMVNFAKEKKCNMLLFQPILFSNTRMDQKKENHLWPDHKDISKLKETIAQLQIKKESKEDPYIATAMPILAALPNYFSGKKLNYKFSCSEGIKRMVITCDGKLWSCKGIYGDLRKETLKKIWLSKKALKIRKKVKKCKEHCLQDCVYSSSDIENQIKEILSQINSNEKFNINKLKDRLQVTLNMYAAKILNKEQSCFLKTFKSKKEPEIISYLKELINSR